MLEVEEEEEVAMGKKAAMKERVIRRGRTHDAVDLELELEVPIFMEEEEGDEVQRRRAHMRRVLISGEFIYGKDERKLKREGRDCMDVI